jgi:tetratricopeptide (TPR) repeat protein
MRLNPGVAEAHGNLGTALLQQGRYEEAIAEFRQALQINPADAGAHINLGNALLQDGHAAEAIGEAQKALDLQPADTSAQNNLAWMLATAPQASLRNGARALQLASQASQSSGGNNPVILRTLAAAYAEAGQYSNAIQAAQRALELAENQSNTALASALPREIELYEAGRPFEEVR